jgi:hypothetical protein
MNKVDNDRFLARCQLLITTLIILIYAGLWILAGIGKITADAPKDMTAFVGIIIYYWFQRQRPHSAGDTPDTVVLVPPNPTQPPPAAK